MRGKVNCDLKKLYLEQDQEQRNDVISNLKNGIDELIGTPNIGEIEKIEEKLKGVVPNRKELQGDLKREKARHDEHKVLSKYLKDVSIEIYKDVEITTTPEDFLENRINQIQGFFERAFNEGVYAYGKGADVGGLNDKDTWDAGKIRAVRRRIQKSHDKYYSRKGKIKLSGWENTVKAPLNMVADLDQTGAAAKLVKDSQQLLDSFLQSAMKWKEPVIERGLKGKTTLNLQNIDSQISSAANRGTIEEQNLSGWENTEIASRLFEELIHTEVRNIIPKDIPTDPKKFQAWRNSYMGKKFFELQKQPSERHEMGADGGEYVLIPLHVDKEGVKYLQQQRKLDIKEGKYSEQTNPMKQKLENAYLAYRIPSNFNSFLSTIRSKKNITKEKLEQQLESNKVEEGFYTAQEDRAYPYDLIKGTNKPKKKYAAFTRGVNFRGEFVYQPPNEWMPGIWKALEDQRKWSELFFESVIKDEWEDVQNNYSEVRNKVIEQLTLSGYDSEEIESILSKVEMAGIQDNYWEDAQGNLLSSNSLARKVNRFSYGYIKYQPEVNDRMMRDAIEGLEDRIEELESTLANFEYTLEDKDADSADIYEAEEQIQIGEEKLKEYKEALNAFNTKLFSDPSTDAERQDILMADKILSTKHRSLYADKTQRIKDRSVWRDYVDQTYRALHGSKLKTQAFKTILSLRNEPALVKYLVNEVRNATGEQFTESGFLGFDYSDERIAELMPGNTDPKSIRATGLFLRSLKTGFNLGFNTGFTNNFQRINLLLNYGIDPWQAAVRAVDKGDVHFTPEEILSQVRETGVLEPGNAMIDMLAIGMSGAESNYREALLPLRDMIALSKNTSLGGWLSSSKGWDKILSRASQRSEQEKIKVEELIRIKTLLWEFMHESKADKKYLKKLLNDMKLGLRQDYANRLVQWRISWFPFGMSGSSMFTLKGGEERMRLETAYMGLRKAYDMGLVTIPAQGRFKYTDSKEAVQMARLYVYSNMFGMNSPHLAKAFRSAFGGLTWQWKQFDWFQTQDEYRKLTNAILSTNSKYPMIGGMTLPSRMMMQIMKKSARGTGKILNIDTPSISKKTDDKMVDDFTNFFLTKGVASLISATMFWGSDIYGALAIAQKIGQVAGVRNPLTQRAVFGLASPLVSRSYHAMMVALLALNLLPFGAEEDDVLEDILRDYSPAIVFTIFLLIMDFEKNFTRGIKTWLPSGPKEIITSKEFMDFYNEF
tara:strand:- start:3902 stop:7567 length:3666 start_codon:yes stop_codon:yes gene_type:complete